MMRFFMFMCVIKISFCPPPLLWQWPLFSGQVSLGVGQSGPGTRSALTNERPRQPQVSGGRSAREGTGAEARTARSSRQWAAHRVRRTQRYNIRLAAWRLSTAFLDYWWALVRSSSKNFTGFFKSQIKWSDQPSEKIYQDSPFHIFWTAFILNI